MQKELAHSLVIGPNAYERELFPPTTPPVVGFNEPGGTTTLTLYKAILGVPRRQDLVGTGARVKLIKVVFVRREQTSKLSPFHSGSMEVADSGFHGP